MKSFNNKIVVITGAGSGMGRAYAMEFSKLGAKLALNDYDENSLLATKELLRQQNNSTVVYTEAFNVADKQAMYCFAENVKKTLGNAHVIINNAGIEGSNLPVFTADEKSYEHVMNINFYGVLFGTKAFLPQLVENNEGAIVNVSSIFGLIGTPNSGEYCASKFAVRGFTESLMVEFKKSPISIHCVHPGGIATNIIQDNNKDFGDKYLTTPPEKIARYVIRSIQCKRSKIVYGHGALKVWLGANFVPQNILNHLLWHELKKVISLEHYSKFIKKLNNT